MSSGKLSCLPHAIACAAAPGLAIILARQQSGHALRPNRRVARRSNVCCPRDIKQTGGCDIPPMKIFWFIAALTATNAAAQSSAPTNPCAAVHTAYKKTFQVGANMETKNSGPVNVTEAQGTITDDKYTETCQLLRDERLHGEATNVYSEVMKAPSGTANGTIWISKSGGLVLQQEVTVDMGAKGKGTQTITFNYKKQ